METLLRSPTVDFPRRKIYLTHLNQLIERKIILQPEIQVSSKLFPQRDFAKKLSISHQRVKSSVQMRSQRFDLQWSNKKLKDIRISSNGMQPQTVKIHDTNYMAGVRSTQLQTGLMPAFDLRAKMHSTHSVFAQNFSSSPTLSHDQPRESVPKKFLKKGSSLQKQIVVNLLRAKLLKQQQDKEKKEYSNNEILKMIQVFKGVGGEGHGRRAGEQTGRSSSLQRMRQEQLKEIKGWEEDSPQFEEQDQK